MAEKGIVGKIIDDMKEDARKQHEIDKANFELIKKRIKRKI